MRKIVITGVAVVSLVGSAAALASNNGVSRIREILTGLKEVPVTSTTGNGTFHAEIDDEAQEIRYTLTFADLEGDVRQSHIHIAPAQNSGNIMLWLCQTAANPSPVATTPQCSDPNNPGTARANTVTGVLTGADIVASATANGVVAGEFNEAVALIRSGLTYVNVHSVKFPPGEIRSQIEHGGHGSGNK
jgi:hypothetical protein